MPHTHYQITLQGPSKKSVHHLKVFCHNAHVHLRIHFILRPLSTYNVHIFPFAYTISLPLLFHFISFPSLKNQTIYSASCLWSPPPNILLILCFYGCRRLFSLVLMLLSPQCNAGFRMRPHTPTPGIHSLSFSPFLCSAPSSKCACCKIGPSHFSDFNFLSLDTCPAHYFDGCRHSLLVVIMTLTFFFSNWNLN